MPRLKFRWWSLDHQTFSEGRSSIPWVKKIKDNPEVIPPFQSSCHTGSWPNPLIQKRLNLLWFICFGSQFIDGQRNDDNFGEPGALIDQNLSCVIRFEQRSAHCSDESRRTYRTIRRWIVNGCDIRDPKQLKAYLRLCGARRITKATARDFGRAGGQAVTQAKRAASRRNGVRGGRPRRAFKDLSHRYRKRLMARLNSSVIRNNSQRYKRNWSHPNFRDIIGGTDA